jgi:isopenicillin N synthase-like dioxygenase
MKHEVPVIDLQPFLSGTDKATVVRQVADACARTGFLVVTGHGVPAETIAAMLTAAQRFFDLPSDDKLTVRPDDPTIFRGYSPLASFSLAGSMGTETAPDLREGFTVGGTGSVWPAVDRAPGFVEACNAYYQAQDRLAASLMEIFALALELPEDFFENKVNRRFSDLVAYHYPPMSAQPKPGQLRGGAHTDFGSLTLVYAHPTAKGLQVWDGSEWEDVPAVSGTFVVNLGDLMAQWTNDLWVSTLHRVANPADTEWDQSRYSLVFFHQPNADVLVQSLDRHNAAKYAPITSGEHLARKIEAMRVD